MSKKGLIKLKLGTNVYFYAFYWLTNDFLKILKIGRFLAKKRSFSTFFSLRFLNFFFDGKRNRAFKNAQIWLKISILVAYYVFNKSCYGFWMILNFGDFMGLQSCQEGGF